MKSDTLERKIDGLYREPLESFVAARNALAAKLKRIGEAADATRVGALTKPSRPAWIVNQLYWDSRRAFRRLMAVAEAMRELQQGSPGAEALREADGKRRKALEALREEAHRRFAGKQETLPPALLRRVEGTLEAIAALGPDNVDPPPGRLAAEIEPPGFGVLFPLLPARGGKPRPAAKPAAKKEVASAPPRRTKSSGTTTKASAKKPTKVALDKKAAAAAKRERELNAARARAIRAHNELDRRESVVRRVLDDRERGRQEEQRAKDEERQAKQRLSLARARVKKTQTELERVGKELKRVQSAVRRAKQQSDEEARKLRKLEKGAGKR